MRIPYLSSLLLIMGVFAAFFSAGCQQRGDLSSAKMPVGMSASADPDAYLEVDCLLPGQVRKLGTMVYASPRRPLKTTAGDCAIRGGEYVVYDRANYKESLAVWMVEAETGDPVAQTYVGEIYMNSPPGAPRYDLAAKWFLRAAKNGHTRAQVNLAHLYENGLGVTADMDAAARWYGKASGTDVGEIIQQYQISSEERAELELLKAENAAKAEELQRLRGEVEDAQRSLQKANEDLAVRKDAIDRQRQEMVSQQLEMEQIAARIQEQGSQKSSALEQQLALLSADLQKRERELRAQQKLAENLSSQIEQTQQEAQEYKMNLSSLNERLANLPGPKIEVLDPQLLRTRGIIVAPVEAIPERELTGKVWAPAGLQYLRINGQVTDFKPDGKFRAVLPLLSEELPIEIVATDINGKVDTMAFTLKKGETRDAGISAEAARRSEESLNLDFGRYYALVIGNNNYTALPQLSTAIEDARVVAELLEQRYGFEVTVIYDADRRAVLSTLNDFRKKLTEKDNFLIYYAGHGTLEERNTQGFWLPIDSSPDDDVNWIPTDRITGIMNLMSAKQILVIADACYSGMMTRAGLTRLETGKSDEEYNKWLKKMVKYKSRVIISSGENKPVLDGGGGKHSVFAKALLETLGGNEKVLLGMDLHRAIAKKVVDASGRLGHDQVPQYAGLNRAGHELGDFLFVPNL